MRQVHQLQLRQHPLLLQSLLPPRPLLALLPPRLLLARQQLLLLLVLLHLLLLVLLHLLLPVLLHLLLPVLLPVLLVLLLVVLAQRSPQQVGHLLVSRPTHAEKLDMLPGTEVVRPEEEER